MQLRQLIVSGLLIFLLAFQPVLPYLQYFIFKNYIAKNLCIEKDIPDSCCQGKCFLEKKVQETAPIQTAEKESKPVINFKQSIYILPFFNRYKTENTFKLFETGTLTCAYDFIFIKGIFHPPNCF